MNHNFDIICLSETDLDSFIQHDDERLHLNGHLTTIRGGVGICFKEFLATRQVELNKLNESIVFEVCIQNKKRLYNFII